MLDIGLPEMMVIMVVVLLVFGPGKLPEVGRGLGKALGEFRRMTSGVGLLDALEQPAATAAAPRASVAVVDIHCVTCGAGNAAANRFCGTCGRTLANETATSNSA